MTRHFCCILLVKASHHISAAKLRAKVVHTRRNGEWRLSCTVYCMGDRFWFDIQEHFLMSWTGDWNGTIWPPKAISVPSVYLLGTHFQHSRVEDFRI